jgi:hypothetical protein
MRRLPLGLSLLAILALALPAPAETVWYAPLTLPLAIAQGGTGTTSPAIVAGSNVTVSGSWPNQTVNAAGSVTSVSGSGGTSGLTLTGGPITGSGTLTLGGLLNVASGGTGTASPAIVAGSNVTVSGSWPNQTINYTPAYGAGLTAFAGGGQASATPLTLSTINFITTVGTAGDSIALPAATAAGQWLDIATDVAANGKYVTLYPVNGGNDQINRSGSTTTGINIGAGQIIECAVSFYNGTSNRWVCTPTTTGVQNDLPAYNVNGQLIDTGILYTAFGRYGTAGSWTNVQTYSPNDLAILGSSTGITTLLSGSTTATNYTATFPNVNSTVMELSSADTITAVKTFSTGSINMTGAGVFEANTRSLGSGTAVTACSVPTGAGGSPICTVTHSAGSFAENLTFSGGTGSFTGTTMTVTFPNPAPSVGYLCRGDEGASATALTQGVLTSAMTSTTVTTLTFYSRAGVATAPGLTDTVFITCTPQ